jgi:SAM-dependent methyltransferase
LVANLQPALLRAVEARFYENIDLPAPTLDLGCGDGHFASLAFDRPLEVGLDPWSVPLQEAEKRGSYLQVKQTRGNSISFEDGYFASAVSNSVLEHIPELDPVLIEGRPLFFACQTIIFLNRYRSAIFLIGSGSSSPEVGIGVSLTALRGTITVMTLTSGKADWNRLDLRLWIGGTIFHQKPCMFWNGDITLACLHYSPGEYLANGY